MIRVFPPDDKIFTSNGDVVGWPLKAKAHKEDNGDYYLDFGAGIQYADYLVSGKIIVVDTPQGHI